MKVFTIASRKGGVGKTCTAVSMAHGLALKDYEVLLLDVDPQGQAASALGVAQEAGIFDLLVSRRPLRDLVRTTGRLNLYLLPGNVRTATAQIVLTSEGASADTLLTRIMEQFNGHAAPDFVVIDTAPSVSGLQQMALWAADVVVIPTACDSLSTEGVAETIAALDNLRRTFGWRGEVMGILPTFFDQRTNESKAVLADLRETMGENMIMTPIHLATVLRESVAYSRTIFEHAPKSRAAEEYARLVWEVLERYG